VGYLGGPSGREVSVAVFMLDLAVDGEHGATHEIPILWRLHRVHHADPDIDVTTGIRFHPFEIVLSMAYKMVVVIALGPTAFAVFLFEALLNSMSLATHANLRLPKRIDAAIRLVLVTPDMHRVHHSAERDETDSNFGFNLSVWDRIFGTYRSQPRAGHTGMTIGLSEYPDESPTHFAWSLLLPFRGTSGRERFGRADGASGARQSEPERS